MRMKARFVFLFLSILLFLVVYILISQEPDRGKRHEGKPDVGRKGRRRPPLEDFRIETEDSEVIGNSVKDDLNKGKYLKLSNEKYDNVNLSMVLKNDSPKEIKYPAKPMEVESSDGSCKVRHNITFIKVHKTGSSTVQNIFLRYGDKHNLSFVLPPVGHHLGYPNYFQERHMIPSKNVNIFCHHARFSLAIPSLMPPSTVYITIVRDPVKVFESSFTYFKMDYRLGMVKDPNALMKFLAAPQKHYNEVSNKVHLKNPMLYDLGMEESDFTNMDKINREIKIYEKRYQLVMVAEYFEESLILLRDLLCWRTEDVVVFKMNARNEDSVQSLSEKNKEDIRNWNEGDIKLYNYFKEILLRKIQSYGVEKMQQEVSKLKQKTEELFSKCIQSDSASREKGDFKVWQPPGVKINAFVLKEEAKESNQCQRMIEPEIQYTKFLRDKQFPFYQKSKDILNKVKPLKQRSNSKRIGILQNLGKH